MPFMWVRKVFGPGKYGVPVRVFSVGDYYNVPNFAIDWRQFSGPKAYTCATPLLSVIIGKQSWKLAQQRGRPRPSKLQIGRAKMVTLSCPYHKVARGKVVVNSHRAAIMAVINEIAPKTADKCLKVQLNPLCSFVPTHEVAAQLRVALQQFVTSSSFMTKNEKTPNNTFSALFPFDLKTWKTLALKKNAFSRYFHESSKTSMPFEDRNPRGHYLIAHHYRIHHSAHLEDLYNDLIDFKALLDKFNFLQFIQEVRKDVVNKQFAAQMRLIKSLKWRTQESEQYLLFLMRCHSYEIMQEMLESFAKVYQDHMAWKKQ